MKKPGKQAQKEIVEIQVVVATNLIVRFDISKGQIAGILEVPVDVVKTMRDELTKYTDYIYPGYINNNKKNLPGW